MSESNLKKHAFQDSLTLLKLYQSLRDGSQVWLVVKDQVYLDNDDPWDKSYFYDEHTCPTNFLGVEAVYEDTDGDPHGLFQWVRTIPLPDGYGNRAVDYRLLFPEIGAEGDSVIDGELATNLLGVG